MNYNNLTYSWKCTIKCPIVLLSFPHLSLLISYVRSFSGSTLRARINVSFYNAVSANQPVTYFNTDGPPEHVWKNLVKS